MSSADNSAGSVDAERANRPGSGRRSTRISWLLGAILVIAAVLRLFRLGESSLWYDEVVTMRLARTEGPAPLVRLLGQIDATRAPLHPLILQGWLVLFGVSDLAGRALSVLCGIITIVLVFWIGVRTFGVATALWASWLCAISPLMVYYSRETRMYMWLALLTCLAWGQLFSRARTGWRLSLLGLSMAALIYSHPLGLLMASALALAAGLFRHAFAISWRDWLLTHLLVGLAVAPWVGHYLDHPPESTSGLLSLRYLLGLPIGFIGGNFAVLFICFVIIIFGLLASWRNQQYPTIASAVDPTVASLSLLIWFIVPPALLYLYSRVSHPIFGPSRYTLFVGPAYLLLVGRGMARLAWPLAIAAGAASAVLAGAMLQSDVYRPGLKADWRDVAAYLQERDPDAVVAVISAEKSGMTELETARYYFGPGRSVISWPVDTAGNGNRPDCDWVAVGLPEQNAPARALPAALAAPGVIRETIDFSRIRLMKVNRHPSRATESNRDEYPRERSR